MPGLDPLAVGAVACVALAVITLIGLEIVRSVIGARRKAATGEVATGDITHWALIAIAVLLAAAFVLGVACAVRHWVEGTW